MSPSGDEPETTLDDLAVRADASSTDRASDVSRRLFQIRDSAALAAAIVQRSQTKQGFMADPIHRAAAMHAVGQIGEAVRHLPDDFKAARPDVPWRLIRAMRNRISHGYDSVDPQILWESIATGVPDLVAALSADLAALDTE